MISSTKAEDLLQLYRVRTHNPSTESENRMHSDEEKWARKGHEFVRLYVTIRTGESIVAEVLHTAIFRPRPADAGAGVA